jgi:hypothetical protein
MGRIRSLHRREFSDYLSQNGVFETSAKGCDSPLRGRLPLRNDRQLLK